MLLIPWYVSLLAYTNVWDSVPDPGSGAFLSPGSGMGKKSGSGSMMNELDHIFKSLETIFLVKILKFLDADPGSGIRDRKKNFASGVKKVRDPG
jgi:hypothetical protein